MALYRSRPGATIAVIDADLRINRETLRSWVRADDQRRGGGGAGRPAAVATPESGSVEAENAELRRRVRELEEERYSVKRLCQILGVARSSYYYWTSTAEARAARQAADTHWPGRSARSTRLTAPTASRGSPPSYATAARWSTTNASSE